MEKDFHGYETLINPTVIGIEKKIILGEKIRLKMR